LLTGEEEEKKLMVVLLLKRDKEEAQITERERKRQTRVGCS